MAIADEIKGRLNQYEIAAEDIRIVVESMLGASKVLRGHSLSHRRRELFKEFRRSLDSILKTATCDLSETARLERDIMHSERAVQAEVEAKQSLLKTLDEKNTLLDEVQRKSAERWKACNIKDDDISKLKAEIASLHKANSVAVMDRNTVQQKLDNALFDMHKMADAYNRLVAKMKACGCEEKPKQPRVPGQGCGYPDCPSCYV